VDVGGTERGRLGEGGSVMSAGLVGEIGGIAWLRSQNRRTDG
jgi:hypothetical protein